MAKREQLQALEDVAAFMAAWIEIPWISPAASISWVAAFMGGVD